MDSDVRRYLESWADELISRAGRVRLLIGDAHWLSDGHHKEYLLRDFISRHLPLGLLVTRGFVRPPDDNLACSPENDILITDPGRHAPFFNEGGLVIAPPSSIVAFVEAKTTLSKAKLCEALAAQAATCGTISMYVPDITNIWRGIVFATVRQSASLPSSMTTIQNAIASVFSGNATLTASCLPKCIATYDRYFFLLTPLNNDRYRLRGFDLGKLSIACFLNELVTGIGSLNQTLRPHAQLGDIVARISADQLARDADLRSPASENGDLADD